VAGRVEDRVALLHCFEVRAANLHRLAFSPLLLVGVLHKQYTQLERVSATNNDVGLSARRALRSAPPAALAVGVVKQDGGCWRRASAVSPTIPLQLKLTRGMIGHAILREGPRTLIVPFGSVLAHHDEGEEPGVAVLLLGLLLVLFDGPRVHLSGLGHRGQRLVGGAGSRWFPRWTRRVSRQKPRSPTRASVGAPRQALTDSTRWSGHGGRRRETIGRGACRLA